MEPGGTIEHPTYVAYRPPGSCLSFPLLGGVERVYLGDEVALADDPATCVGVVTAIYLDGLLELSTGDNDVLAADLVLLRRAEA